MKCRPKLIQFFFQRAFGRHSFWLWQQRCCITKYFLLRQNPAFEAAPVLLFSGATTPPAFEFIFGILAFAMLFHIIRINVRVNLSNHLPGKLKCFFIKHDQNNLHFLRHQESTEYGNGNLQNFILRKTVYTSGNQWKRNTHTLQLYCFFQRFHIAAFQYLKLMCRSVFPDWSHCVDDILCREMVCFCYCGIASGYFTYLFPFLQQ